MAPAVIPGKALAGGLVVLLSWDPAKDHHILKGVSDLECLHKDLDDTTGMSPESLPHGGSGLKGDSLRRCGASCHGKCRGYTPRRKPAGSITRPDLAVYLRPG